MKGVPRAAEVACSGHLRTRSTEPRRSVDALVIHDEFGGQHSNQIAQKNGGSRQPWQPMISAM
jgi:hypothetical protein